jgi:(2R)-sulfolactate sulfo-lyase subunit alpha
MLQDNYLREGSSMSRDFIVHDAQDTVGVAVLEEGLRAGTEASGWVLETMETVSVQVLEDVPLGHKVAVRAMDEGATVVKYGHDIGRTVAPIPMGGYAHAHNVKTKRW